MTIPKPDLNSLPWRVAAISLLSVCLLVVYLVILVFPNASKEYTTTPPTITSSYARALSPECQAKARQAEVESVPLRSKRQAVNTEQAKLYSKYAVRLPAGYYPDGLLEYMSKEDKERYNTLGDQYLDYGHQLDAIESKYACTD